MEPKNLGQLNYVLLPGGTAGKPELRDAAFRFWRAFWGDVYRSLGATHAPDPHDFDRQTWFSLFFENDRVVALHAYTLFDLAKADDRSHPYFQRYYPAESLDQLRQNGTTKVLTMEFFSVSREWRSKEIGMSFASVVAGLGVHLAQSLGVDGILSAARTDTGADRIGKAFGAEHLATTQVNGVATELLLFHRSTWHAHCDPEVARWITYFWNRREDGTNKSIAA